MNAGTKKVLVWAGVAAGIIAMIAIFIKLLIKYAPKSDITDDIKVDTSALSFETATYGLMASQLENAMRGVGTDEETIYKVLGQLKTKEDWSYLVKTFGVRKDPNFLSKNSGTLIDWLQSELSSKERKKANAILQSINVVI